MGKYRRVSKLFLLGLLLLAFGCSGGSDPMGTGTIQFVQEYSTQVGTGSPGTVITITKAEVEPNGSLTLTVWVSNFTSDGKLIPVVGEKVSFWLDSPGNGASLSVLNDRTASNGQARVIYAAGNNLFTDVVRAQTGAGATASITITKTGTTTRGPVVALTPPGPATVAPLGFLTITATVTDNGKVLQGERVTFALLTANGATLTVLSGLSNSSGQVTTVYQSGNNNAQDVVQASLSNGAKAQLVINKDGVAPGRSITLAATPSSVTPGQYSVITATVKDSGDNVVSGALVRFSMSTSNGSLSRSELETDGSGVATIIYQAGGDTFESDIIQATTEGAFTSLVITKTGNAVGYTATLVGDPNQFTNTAATAGTVNSKLTATVKDSKGLAAPGLRVRINAPSWGATAGTVTPTNALTGVDGTATFSMSQDIVGVGTIIVTGYVDVNDNSSQDPTDPTMAAVIRIIKE